MSEYMFGITRKRMTLRERKQANEIAKRHGASFIAADIPGNETKGWFVGPNLGEPFDRQLRDAVMADIKAAGLSGWP